MKKLSVYTLEELLCMTGEIQQTIEKYKHVTDNKPTNKFVEQFYKFMLELQKEHQQREEQY